MSDPTPVPLLDVVRHMIEPASLLLPDVPDCPEARLMLLTIGQQESRFMFRRQMGNGPARGFWQFEQGGGVKGVCMHPKSRPWVMHLCFVRHVDFSPRQIWAALEKDDVFAAAIARLLLYTDPQRLPRIGDVDGAWELYALRTWRPGKPHRQTWDAYYEKACQTLGL
jgi:hypothetical protein